VDGSFGFFNEALTFSQTQIGGNARMQGIGGAQVSLGGDISTIHSNPAGLGFYRKSEFSITPQLNFFNTDASFFGNTLDRNRTKFTVGNLGVVINRSKDDVIPGKWRGGSFGISITRINDFNNIFQYRARNLDNSIIDFFLEQAEGIPPSELTGLTGFAFDHFLINPIGNTNSYSSFVTGAPIQEETVRTEGSQYQWDFAYGANYNDKIYFGLGLGITTLDYQQDRLFIETDFDDPQFPDDDPIRQVELSTQEIVDIDGAGVNGNFGLIVRPLDILRLGLSVTTPTFYAIDDESEFDLLTDFKGIPFPEEDTVLGEFFSQSDIFLSDYNLRTPWRINFGTSVFFNKQGFISADIEFIDYSSAEINSNEFPTFADNETIENIYESSVNFRVGGEYRLNPLYFRAGFSRQADPLRISDNVDRARNSFSFGLGYRNQDFSVDLAVVHTRFDGIYSPYTTINTPSPIVNLENRTTNALLSVGVFF